jgi:hypothetical protein
VREIESPMITKRTLVAVVLAFAALALGGCDRGVTSRYKLTLSVNTPQGVKTASSVVESYIWPVTMPARGVRHRLKGEAVYLDLGPGRRPLIALLTSSLQTSPGVDPEYWSKDGGPMTDYVLRLYGEDKSKDDFLTKKARLANYRGPREIPIAALPDFVTFIDVTDPKSVIAVDPNNLEATLGPGISWNKITVEMTNERLTNEIENKLPWLRSETLRHGSLDGSRTRYSNELSNRLDTGDFKKGGH